MNDFGPSTQLIVRDRTLDLSVPQIMGVLNATPDSFSDGGRFNDRETALGHIGLMISQGASIIDIGGESTRPGSDPVTEKEETDRVIPLLEEALATFPDTLFSVDTTKYRVAQQALEKGAHIINDISGLREEPRLAELCSKHAAGYIMMHSQGNPKIMQDNPVYDDVVNDIMQYFSRRLSQIQDIGLDSIIIDPGIGFGKTLQHNIEILKNLDKFLDLGYPLMVGASRKSMIGKLLGGRPADDRLTGTVAVHYHAMLKGAKIIRVHDVKQANDSVLVYNALSENKNLTSTPEPDNL